MKSFPNRRNGQIYTMCSILTSFNRNEYLHSKAKWVRQTTSAIDDENSRKWNRQTMSTDHPIGNWIPFPLLHGSFIERQLMYKFISRVQMTLRIFLIKWFIIQWTILSCLIQRWRNFYSDWLILDLESQDMIWIKKGTRNHNIKRNLTLTRHCLFALCFYQHF